MYAHCLRRVLFSESHDVIHIIEIAYDQMLSGGPAHRLVVQETELDH